MTREIPSGTRASTQDASCPARNVRLRLGDGRAGHRCCDERCRGGGDVARPLVAVPPPELRAVPSRVPAGRNPWLIGHLRPLRVASGAQSNTADAARERLGAGASERTPDGSIDSLSIDNR